MRKIICLLLTLWMSCGCSSGTLTGMASFYSDTLHGRRTASGERYDRGALTAAHKKLKLGTKVRVTNVENNRSVVVRINDRGPYVKGRIIDLSKAAAIKLDFIKKGIVKVKLEIIE